MAANPPAQGDLLTTQPTPLDVGVPEKPINPWLRAFLRAFTPWAT
jgi:hypothetical protein